VLRLIPFLIGALVIGACSRQEPAESAADAGRPSGGAASAAPSVPDLPPPLATPSAVKFSNVVGWPAGRTPAAPAGFEVSLFADDLANPRWLYVLPNGDVLVAESMTATLQNVPPEIQKGLEESKTVGPSANRITLLRDGDGNGTPEVRNTFLGGLNQPFGMAHVSGTLYVANTDSLVRFPYREGETRIAVTGLKVLDLPAGGYNNHWTRNVIARPDGTKLYVSIGSATNVDQEEIDVKDPRRAAILEVNPDGSGMRIFASGLRNPNGMDWEPATGALWTAVNERDELGDDLVPDYITSVRDGGFYGWPFSYFGQHEDPRLKGRRPDLVARAIVPDYAVGAHTASLGLMFYRGASFPQAYRGGAFVSQRGSWNRSSFAGYRVIFVPFSGGGPSGPLQEFLTGFIADPQASQVFGRPVGLAMMRDVRCSSPTTPAARSGAYARPAARSELPALVERPP
jgi:glucose/arabinose dehydrogenase